MSEPKGRELANKQRKIKLLQARALVKKYCSNADGSVVDEFLRERRGESQRSVGN